MAAELHEEADGKILTIKLSGKLTKEDYEHFVPGVDHAIERQGKVRMIVDMHDFHGWTMAAMWEDTKFGWKHYSQIERLAVIGEKSWQHGMTAFCKPFTAAKIQYFDRADAGKAETWIREGMDVLKPV